MLRAGQFHLSDERTPEKNQNKRASYLKRPERYVEFSFILSEFAAIIKSFVCFETITVACFLFCSSIEVFHHI